MDVHVEITDLHTLTLLYRHDVADVAGLTAFSFGEEEVDRYVMVFKKVTGGFEKIITFTTTFITLIYIHTGICAF